MELNIHTIYKVEIGKINSDKDFDPDDENEYKHFSSLALVISLAESQEGNEYCILEYSTCHPVNRSVPIPLTFNSYLPSMEEIESTLKDNEFIVKDLNPLNCESIARLISTTIEGKLSLKEGEYLNDGISYIEPNLEEEEGVIEPCLFSIKEIWKNIKGVKFKEEQYECKECESAYEPEVVKYNNLLTNTSNFYRLQHEFDDSKDYIYVLEGVDWDTEKFFAN